MSASPKQITRANHYVPQAYLKRWAADDDRVWTSRLLVSHPQVALWSQVSPKGLAKHQHLYTRVMATGESDEIEEWFNAEFETPALAPIERAISGARLSRADWCAIIRFLAAQDARTPARMHEGMKRWERTLPGILDDVLTTTVAKLEDAQANGVRPKIRTQPFSEHFPLKVIKEFRPGDEKATLQVRTVAGRGLWLFSLRHLLTQTIDILFQHKWTILECPGTMQWLTSDDPVIKLNYNSPGNYDFKGGWGSRGTEIFMPLGPKHLLFTVVGGRPPARGTVITGEIARSFQRFTVEHAHRYIFAASPEPEVEIWRPRRVSQADFLSETEQWRNWPESQSKAERGLMWATE